MAVFFIDDGSKRKMYRIVVSWKKGLHIQCSPITSVDFTEA